MVAQPTLYLIDGSSQMHRAYHAIKGLTGPGGRSTNAVFGFVTMLRKLISEHDPALIATSFDLAGPTFRSALSTDYKANRPPMPADLAEQVPWVHASCEALGVPVITCEGFEADDVIGTVAERAAAEGYAVAIVTGDKDLFQLVRDGVRVFNPRDEGTWYDGEAVKEKLGVPPLQVADLLALTGDPVDNIKGVPGIGDKGGRELIARYGSLDSVLEQAGQIAEKRYREALLAHPEEARQSLELARIRTDVPLVFDVESFRYRGPSRERCFELFSQLGFKSLLMEFAPDAQTPVGDYRIVETLDELRELGSAIQAAGRFAFRVLPSASAAMRADVVGIALSAVHGQARYLPLGHRALESRDRIAWSDAIGVLRPVFEDPAVKKVGHDLKFDVLVLARHGIDAVGLAFDTMLASYLLDPTGSAHSLEDAALEHLNYKAITEEDVCGRGSKALSLDEVPAAAVVHYAGERADLPLQLADRLGPVLAAEGLARLHDDLELPLVPVLAAIERAGVRIDAGALAALSRRIDKELASRSERIVELAGQEFNINSPKQLGEVLFDKLKLPALKRTGKTRVASTAVEVLEELALSHELPRQILEWRALQKLKGTYVDALPQLIDPVTGRVHTSFNQAVAATGRLSSSDPNLQNIPIRTELGREIRAAFVAEPGSVLISADYSQIELRILAHLSGDEALTDAFRRGDDIHDRTALKVFGPDSGLDKHELRRRAKVINYALLYGKTAFTLAKDLGVTQQAAQEFIDAYFAGFPAVRRYLDETLAEARVTGAVKTLFGRRRLVPELTSPNGQVRAAAERVAVNLPLQGTAADILKRAMIDLHNALDARAGGRADDPRMILTVHDELVFEAPAEAAEDVAALVRQGMEHAVALTVPLTVEVGIGRNWSEAKG